MKLCVPTFCNYDGVDALVRSAEAGSQKPSGYVVIDNGGGYDSERLAAVLASVGSTAPGFVAKPGINLGCAASWNYFLEHYGKTEPIVISNDDIILGHEAFLDLVTLSATAPRAGFGWAIFMQRPDCTEKVGYYDENFWPAYYEDIDYLIRMARAGVPDTRLEGTSFEVQHAGWTTTNKLGDADWLRHGRARNLSYLVAKWGTAGLEGDTHEKAFLGHGPGLSLHPRRSFIERRIDMPLRFEVVNEIGKLIGAKRYLELGLADGDCIKRIKIAEKWGVDMAPAPADTGGARTFETTTDDFFAKLEPGEKFDVVFIDADHDHRQVTRDVRNALRVLTPDGVVVMHDCSPHSEDMQLVPPSGGSAWTGDVWKTIVRLRWEGQHEVRVIDSDYGVGVIVPGAPPTHLKGRPYKPEVVTYRDLVARREDLLGLVPAWEWKDWFSRTLARRAMQRELDKISPSVAKPGVGEYFGPVDQRWGLTEAGGRGRDLSEPKRDELVVVFSTLPRADTTGVHLLKAFERIGVKVRHVEPLVGTVGNLKCGSDEMRSEDFPHARAMLCIDDDHGWCVPSLGVPRYYWCIDSYRMDDKLYLEGTRRERIKKFEKVFFAQEREAEEFKGVWLPLGVDPELYQYKPLEKLYDFCFIGNSNLARDGFIDEVAREFPRSFVGQAYGEEANKIYNQSLIALNVSAGPDVNMRMFEGSATSALLVANRVKNGEGRLLPYVPLFDGLEECLAMMRVFLKNPTPRTLLAVQQADTIEGHTYEARARLLLTEIGFPIP